MKMIHTLNNIEDLKLSNIHKDNRNKSDKGQLTLAASHSLTDLSKEEVAKIVEPDLNLTSVTRSECVSVVVTQSKFSMFQMKTCHHKLQ